MLLCAVTHMRLALLQVCLRPLLVALFESMHLFFSGVTLA